MHVSVLPRLKTIDPPGPRSSLGTAGLVYQREECDAAGLVYQRDECDAAGDAEIRPIVVFERSKSFRATLPSEW
jgi:hypothetical protein